MHNSVFLVGVVIAASVLLARAVARKLGIPDAVAFVVLGLIGSAIPGASEVRVQPDVILLIFLPPLIFYAGFFSDARLARANFGTITGMAVGLVIVTAVSVMAVMHLLVPEVGWAAALALGAAVAPPDVVAATSVMTKLRVPRRVVTIVEGEGLINDGISLTLFALAVESVGQTVTVGHASLRGVEAIVGGVAFGLLVGWVVSKLRHFVRDPNSQIVVSLLTPYLAYIPAERFHGSGVLATLAAAAWLGTGGRGLFQPTSRVQGQSFWGVLIFLIEATLFVLLGLQVPEIVRGIGDYSPGLVAAASGCVLVTVIVVRMVWQLFLPPIGARLWPGDEVLALRARERTLIGWCGLRGAISLAIALSIPATLDGEPFPGRSLLLFVTLVVVLGTLIGQGSLLPAVIRLLKVSQSEQEQGQGLLGRRRAAEAALAELESQVAEGDVQEESARALRPLYESRLERLREVSAGNEPPESSTEIHRLRLQLLKTQRQAVRDLYAADEIGADVQVEINHEIDLEEARLRRRETAE